MQTRQLEQKVVQLPHYMGFKVTARIGDTFEMGDNTYKIVKFSTSDYCSGQVNCELIKGEISEDLKPYVNTDKTIDLCADSVALFLYETVKKKPKR